jgi:hypothetical protein|tara:strand:+ start:503 stop:628 length:126 start_codon:yes stop_codon:yes gene_type:complete
MNNKKDFNEGLGLFAAMSKANKVMEGGATVLGSIPSSPFPD